ncbi:transcription elongation factor GreA, partial [Candidatus Saccharibacteria bacterium]|nr:transcription elongation factor GreA [Candidatus Saccharibacteria bacterium]
MKKSVNLTKEGKQALEEELAALKARRPEITEKIATARAFGDLSENEEYSSARSEQKTVENRILEIEEILKSAKIIRSAAHSKVVLGATVKVKVDGKQKIYSIVGPVEANPLEGKISDQSPIGKALLGLKEGDSTTFNNKTYKVVE